SLVEGRARSAFERDVLPAFLGGRRWFAEKGSPFIAANLAAGTVLQSGDPGIMLGVVEVTTGRGASRYVIPLGVKWTRFDRIASAAPATVLGAVRRNAREGTLLDVSTDPEFISLLLDKLHAADTIQAGDRRIDFRPTQAFSAMPRPFIEHVKANEGEQSNTTALVDDRFVVKVFRRVHAGPHPEAEMGRFLTDVVHYRNAPPFLGAMELREGESCTALAVVHGFVQNQGDAWTVTNAYLDRFIDEPRVLTPAATAGSNGLSSSP